MKIEKCKLILATSIDGFGDVCTCIEDKGNGNAVAANDVDDEYESLFLHAPEMYKFIENMKSYLNDCCKDAKNKKHMVIAIEELLAKARGES